MNQIGVSNQDSSRNLTNTSQNTVAKFKPTFGGFKPTFGKKPSAALAKTLSQISTTPKNVKVAKRKPKTSQNTLPGLSQESAKSSQVLSQEVQDELTHATNIMNQKSNIDELLAKSKPIDISQLLPPPKTPSKNLKRSVLHSVKKCGFFCHSNFT